MTRRRIGPPVVRWLSGLLASVALVAAVTGVGVLLSPYVHAHSLLVLYLLAVLPVAVVWGARLAALTAILSTAVFVLSLLPTDPTPVTDRQDLVSLAVFLVTAIVVSDLASRSRRGAVESARLTEEQSALRRVATLVAQAVSPSAVFEAVTREVGLLCGADLARMERYEPDGTVTGVAAWSRVPVRLAVGTRFDLDGPSVARDVQRTGGPVRLESFAGATGEIATEARALGIRSSVGCPIVVAGVLWGVIAASTKSDEPFPAKTESQIASVTELVATAIENTEARAELRRMADEQAALRRVATLVARGAPPAAVFAAVAEEVGRLFAAESAAVGRYDPDGPVTMVGLWSRTGETFAVGGRSPLGGRNVTTLVFETGRPARVDRYAPDDSSAGTETVRGLGMRSGVGAPITVEDRLWGMLAAESPREAELPAGSEERLADFAELVATAIANAEARAELRRVADEFRRVADEQAALRRVATLVANGAGPDLVFAAVAEEVGKLFGTDATAMWRFEPDGQATLMGAHRWLAQPDLGTRIKPEPQAAVASVRQTGRAARLDVDDPSSARMSAIARREGIRSMVASPIVVDGRLWGTISMGSRRGPLPPDTEQRLADFTKIVATAIANTESREQLAASRARVVAAGDEMRRRLERDLHDGAQQRLVSLALELRLAQDTIPAELLTLRADIGQAAEELIEVAEELREISRGIHPSVLSEGGLGPALRTLAQRSSVPVELHLETDSRYPPPVEVAAYYVVSEALTNTAKHADASHAEVVVEERGNTLWLRVADDGVGGAKPQSGGSGLIGLRDRVEALGGSIHLTSPVGHGTVIQVSLPIERPDAGPAPANAVRAGR